MQLFKPSQSDDNISVTRGLNMALGVLSKSLLQNDSLGVSRMLIETLVSNCVPKGKESDDAETRKQAVKSLGQVVASIGLHKIPKSHVDQIFSALYRALCDYALDRRGDVGSWVREEAMRTLTLLVQSIQGFDLELFGNEAEFYERFVGALLQQLVEKIDRVRAVAGRCLQQFFKFTAHRVGDFKHKDQLTQLFLQEQESFHKDGGALNTMVHDDGIGYLPWRQADFVFAQILPFFTTSYRQQIFRGLITCSGGLTESTMKASQKALFQYLSGVKGDINAKKDFLR
jgi:tubulin-specific chaperone D